MAIVNDVTQHLEAIAQKIDAITDPYARASSARLRDLASALSSGANWEQWAFCDLSQAIDVEQIGEMITRRKTETDRRIESWRSALVLLPLAVTWLGIFLAVGAYSALLAEKPLEGYQSFIYLWQTGFGGHLLTLHLGPLTLPANLGLVAIIDFTVLSVVFGLTIAVHRRNNERSREAVATISDVSSALADTVLLLAPNRAPAPLVAIGKLEQMAEQILQDMAQERERLRQLAAERERDVQGLATFTVQLKSGADTIAQAAGLLQTANEQMSGSAAAVAAGTARLEQSETALNGNLSALQSTLADISSRQDQAATSLQTLAAQEEKGTAALEAAAGHMQTVETSVGAVAGEIMTIGDRLNTFTHEIEQRTSSIGNAATLLQQAHGQISDHLTNLQLTMAQLAKQQELLLPAVNDAATRLDAIMSGQTDAVKWLDQINTQQQQVATTLTGSLDAVASAAGDIRQVGTDLSRVGSSLTTAWQDLSGHQVELIATLEQERAAQERVSGIAAQETANLAQALQALVDFNNKFHSIVIDFSMLARDLPSVSRSLQDMQTTLLRVAADNSDIAQRVAGAATAIDGATQRLDQATQHFEPVLRNLGDESRSLGDAVATLHQNVGALRI